MSIRARMQARRQAQAWAHTGTGAGSTHGLRHTETGTGHPGIASTLRSRHTAQTDRGLDRGTDGHRHTGTRTQAQTTEAWTQAQTDTAQTDRGMDTGHRHRHRRTRTQAQTDTDTTPMGGLCFAQGPCNLLCIVPLHADDTGEKIHTFLLVRVFLAWGPLMFSVAFHS